MNGMLILGETVENSGVTVIYNPYSMIPTEEGIRLFPLDVELTGVVQESISLTPDKVFYTVVPSDVIVERYQELLTAQDSNQDACETPEPQETEK